MTILCSIPDVPLHQCLTRCAIDMMLMKMIQMWSICFAHVMMRLSKCLYPYLQMKDPMHFKCQKWILSVSLVSLFCMIRLLYRGSIRCFCFVAVFFCCFRFCFLCLWLFPCVTNIIYEYWRGSQLWVLLWARAIYSIRIVSKCCIFCILK